MKEIELPRCKVCGNSISYKQYINKRNYCSRECFLKDKDNVIKNRQETNLKRYGVKNPGELKLIQEKRKKTNKERYGVEYILQNKEFVKKVKDTMIERYGVDSYLKTEESKTNNYLKSYKTILNWKDYIEPLFSFEEYQGWKQGKEYKWKCKRCGNVFDSKIYMTQNNKSFTRMPRCINCYPFTTNKSLLEKEVIDFIRLIYEDKILTNTRDIINPKELDVYLSKNKIAIEFDGLFWHNEFSGKDKFYHLNKTKECEQKKIQLLHIFEDEWIEKKEIVKSRIKSKLNIYENKIFARKCEIREISNEEKDLFLDKNHLQGKDISKI